MHDGKSSQPAQNLSETKEIQLAFQREMVLLLNEAGDTANPPTPSMPIPTKVANMIDGREFGIRLKRVLEGRWESSGLKPEHVRVLMSLVFLLEQCARLKATPQNLSITLPFFHPGKPTTPAVADAYDEAINAFASSIKPANERHHFETDLREDGRTCRICSRLPGGENHIASKANTSGVSFSAAEQWWRKLRETAHDMKLLMQVYDDIRKPENFSLLHRSVNQEGFPVYEWVFKDFSMLQLPVKNDIPRVDLIRRGVQCRVMSKSEGWRLWKEAGQYFNREYGEEDRKFLRSCGIEGLNLML
jgi:hypothetical protein